MKKLKFMSEEVAKVATSYVLRAIDTQPLSNLIPNPTLSVLVLVPSSYDNPDDSYFILERNVGNDWKSKYALSARHIAQQIWQGRQDGCHGVAPHLLFEKGDVFIGGGVKRDGIVVACYGVQPHFARMISGMIADTCIAIAYNNYVRWLEDERAHGRKPTVT